MFSPPGLYDTEDINQRLEIIESYRTLWLTGQAVVTVAVVLFTIGFGVLSSTLRTTKWPWVPVLGALAIVAGTISGIYFVYLQTTDPRGGYSGAYPTPENLAYWLWLAGQFLFGVAFLQGGLPSWLGYLTAGAALAYAIVFFLTGAGFMTPFLLALISVAIGVVLLRA